MRRYLRRAVPFAVAVVVSTGLVAAPALAAPGPANPPGPADPPGPASPPAPGNAPAKPQVVEYHGYRITVPGNWDVVDLAEEPDTCVRFDRPTVYLGHPNPEATCPAGLVGRTESLLIRPADQATADQIGTAEVQKAGPDGSLPAPAAASPAHEIVAAVEAGGVVVHASYGPSPKAMEQILATGAVTEAAEPAALPPPSKQSSAEAAGAEYGTTSATTYTVTPGAFYGYGFDTCSTPSHGQMDAWRKYSSYRAVGIYIGGGLRACAQPNLGPWWVARQASLGWRFMPLYVGLQAPCTQFRATINPGQAYLQGVQAAVDATRNARYLGIQPGSVVYYNMEGYDNTNAACSKAVLTFLNGWTDRVRFLGYRSGVYSSATSGIADLNNAVLNPAYRPPDHVWFARWDGRVTVSDPAIRWDYWVHARIKQYAGGHNETHGGVLMNVDSNFLDVR